MPILLVLAPHPDDAVLAAGGVIHRAVRRGWIVHVWHVTHGDGFPLAAWRHTGQTRPIDFWLLAYARRREATLALQRLGVPPQHVRFAGGPDGQLDRLTRQPVTSPWTRARADWYPASPAYGVPYTPTAWRQHWQQALWQLQPDLVILPDPAGEANRDHRAVAHLLAGLPFARWHYAVHGRIAPGAWLRIRLSPAERAAKADAIAYHMTQMAVAGPWLRQFAQPTEVFRVSGKPVGVLAELVRYP